MLPDTIVETSHGLYSTISRVRANPAKYESVRVSALAKGDVVFVGGKLRVVAEIEESIIPGDYYVALDAADRIITTGDDAGYCNRLRT